MNLPPLLSIYVFFQNRDDEIKRLLNDLKDGTITEMEMLRQLTFENVKWTKNFDNFENVDDYLEDDDSEDDDSEIDENMDESNKPKKRSKKSKKDESAISEDDDSEENDSEDEETEINERNKPKKRPQKSKKEESAEKTKKRLKKSKKEESAGKHVPIVLIKRFPPDRDNQKTKKRSNK